MTVGYTELDRETGRIVWDETIGAGVTRTYVISYTVEYPIGMNLAL